MFGLVRQFSGHADEAETLMLHGGCRGSMLGSYGGDVLRLNLLLHVLTSIVFSRSGKFSMTPLQVLSAKIRSSMEETVLMLSTEISSSRANDFRERA